MALLQRYPAWFVTIAADPVSGIPGSFRFCPSIAEAKEWLERQFPIEQRHRELIARPRMLHGPSTPRPLTGAATHDELCAKFGIPDIPAGWDAVDVTIFHHRLGAGFRAYVDKLLAEQGDKPASRGLFGAVVDKARAAREARAKTVTDDELVAYYGRKSTDAA